MSRVVLIGLLLLVPLSGFAQSSIYRTVDEHGNVVFTDAPPAGNVTSETVEVPPTNTSAPPPNIPRPEATKEEVKADIAVSISSPANDTTIPMGPGDFDVTARVSPALSEGQGLQLLVGGIAEGGPQSSPSWALSNISRGSHELSVQVIDAEGAVVATSPTVTVHVQRPSVLNNPNTPPPPPVAPPTAPPTVAPAGPQAR